MVNLKDQFCKDQSGNLYQVVDHYGGPGTPIPEMINLYLVEPALFRINRPMAYIGALSRSVFDKGFTIVKPR